MKLSNTLKGWLPLAIGLTLAFGMAYFVGQQVYRQSAYDPQIQQARDATLNTIDGPIVNLASSLAVFQINLDSNQHVSATTGQLDGTTVLPPAGVFDYVKTHGEDLFTWQPKSGVRLAAVVVKKSGGYVVVARSLSEVERRIDMLGGAVGLGWLLSLALTLGATWWLDRLKSH